MNIARLVTANPITATVAALSLTAVTIGGIVWRKKSKAKENPEVVAAPTQDAPAPDAPAPATDA